MSADTIMAYISDCSHAGRLKLRVSVQCAPVLKGIKVSNLITVAEGSLKILKQALAGTGYWKVCHNPEQARIKFRQYDKARKMAIQQIIDGRSLRGVAVR